jgi:hypothetical protein
VLTLAAPVHHLVAAHGIVRVERATRKGVFGAHGAVVRDDEHVWQPVRDGGIDLDAVHPKP